MSSSKTSDIKAIVFDFGGVIQFVNGGNIIDDIATILSVPEEEFKKEYFKFNHLSNVGNILWEDMIVKVVEVFTDSNVLKNKVFERVRMFHSSKELNHELIAFLPLIRQKGYKTALFSNYTSALRTEIKELAIEGLFDEVVVSGEIGFQKPQKEAFEVLFNKLGVEAQQVIFIDDTPKSLEGADIIGYTPILFTDNAQLKTELEKLGISL